MGRNRSSPVDAKKPQALSASRGFSIEPALDFIWLSIAVLPDARARG
jgi:hypothetical protein